ncbi:MAG: hypothetical protein LUD39_04095 [Opitutae bacterium]|nr:hypothetical protein [Opitutae bacterium]MCD8298923.1 hypothetical protein [Opitutae bacterium]
MDAESFQGKVLSELATSRAELNGLSQRISRIEGAVAEISNATQRIAEHSVVLSNMSRRIDVLEKLVENLRVNQWRLTTFIIAAGGCGAASAGIVELLKSIL